MDSETTIFQKRREKSNTKSKQMQDNFFFEKITEIPFN